MLSSRRSLILGAGAAIITRRALAYPVRLNNPLVYPGINPGINYSHPASGHIVCSGVARAASFIRLDQSAVAGVAGTPTQSIDGAIGPTTIYNSTQANSFLYGGSLTNGMTLAAICRTPVSAPGSNAWFIEDALATGMFLSSGSFSLLANLVNSASVNPFIALVANHAYFIVMAVTGTTNPVSVYFYVLDLGTQQIQTATRSASVNMSLGTFVRIGNSGTTTTPFTGKIAAIAVLGGTLTNAAVAQWANAPWDFWYPPTQRNLMMSGLRSPAASGGAVCPPGSLTGWGC